MESEPARRSRLGFGRDAAIMPEPFFDWLTYTDFALYLRQYPYLIGFLRSIHLLGLTLIGG